MTMRRTRDLVLLGVPGALLVVATIIVTVVAPNTPSPTGESQFGGAFFPFLLAGLTLYWPPSSARHVNEEEDRVGASGVLRFSRAAVAAVTR